MLCARSLPRAVVLDQPKKKCAEWLFFLFFFRDSREKRFACRLGGRSHGVSHLMTRGMQLVQNSRRATTNRLVSEVPSVVLKDSF